MSQFGLWMSCTAFELDAPPPADIPDGVYAAIVSAQGSWFTVDTAGNVRGNPEAVERKALAMGVDENLQARGVVGLARLALRSQGRE